MTDLPVPDASRRAFADQHGLTPPSEFGRRVDWDAVDRDIRAIAGPVVAAVLRALADKHQYEGGVVDVERLRRDAEQCDPTSE